jgi:hypothetical protein
MSNLIKNWNDRAIRIRSDRYVSLTDMAQATGECINDFLQQPRTLSVISKFYMNQEGLIRHPITEEGDQVWVCTPLAKEFSYQSQNHEFSVWMDDILWGDFLHPEVLPEIVQLVKPSHKYADLNEDSRTVSTFVYFILNENTNTVKIGFSRNPDTRLNAFQTGTLDSLVILKIIAGNKNDEAAIHSRFSDYRVSKNREIFRYEGLLKSFIDDL